MNPFAAASDLVRALRAGEVGSRELLESYLERVDRLNPGLNAVVTLDAEGARRAANEADTGRARGKPLGRLHGLPMTIKDSFETAGMRTTCGAPHLSEHVPSHDAVAVARLRAAGAVVFGKTNTPTMAADVQTFNPIFGVTNNPWDVSRSPGGSSGGAAAAVAAGLTGLELGSDIGGSIRTPAHYCGVYGHKSSYGIVPIRGHIPGPPGSLSGADIGIAGPLARSADDLELALDVLAGPDEAEATAWSLSLPPPRRESLSDYRVAAWLDDPHCPVDDSVGELHQAAVDALAAAGCKVDDDARPDFTLAEADALYLALLHGAGSAGLADDAYADLVGRDQAGTSRASLYARNSTQRHRDWLRAHEGRLRMRAQWAELFRHYDVLLCPIVPTAALPHLGPGSGHRTVTVNGEERDYWDQLTWAGLVGMAYLPSTVAPVGRTPEGLPVGVQVVGPFLEDRTCIDVARLMAHEVGGYEPPPGFD